MTTMTHDPASAIKATLRADLREAMKARRTDEIALLRTLVAALDNAEAPPMQAGATEIPRLWLDAAAIRRVLEADIEERERSAAQLAEVGRPDRAATLRTQAALARRYLTD